MGSIIKTISLDGRTQKIADSIPNFSGWVRAKLLELEEKRVTPTRGYEYTCPDCYSYWCFTTPKEWFYCKQMGCDNKDDLTVIGFEVVSLE
jgi:hypothetical protein